MFELVLLVTLNSSMYDSLERSDGRIIHMKITKSTAVTPGSETQSSVLVTRFSVLI